MTHRVRFDPAAETDLAGIHIYVLEQSGSATIAEGYVRRIVADCMKLATFPERGTRRDDVRPNLRTMGFERRATIAFIVEEADVTVLRILYGGQELPANVRR